MNQVRNLVAYNRLKEAIEALKCDANEQVMLLSRLSAYEKAVRSGTRTSESLSIELSQIRQAILDLVPSETTTFNSNSTIVRPTSIDLRSRIEQSLTQERRNEGICASLTELLEQVNAYYVAKSKTPQYDLTGRTLKYLEGQYADIINVSKNLKEDNILDFVDKVTALIADNVPSWDNLDKAYKLCQTKGYNNSFIETNIKNKVSLDRVKVEIATLIETFLQTLNTLL